MILSACQSQTSSAPHIITDFESNVSITQDDKTYEGKILHTPEGINSLTFIAPESISGLTMGFDGKKYTLGLGELSGEYTSNPILSSAGAGNIIAAIDSLSGAQELKSLSKSDNSETFAGVFSETKYEITIDGKGNIKNIKIPKHKISCEFNAI